MRRLHATEESDYLSIRIPAGMLNRVRRLAKRQDGNLSLFGRRLLQQVLDAYSKPARR